VAIDAATPENQRDEALFELLHWDAPPHLDRVTNQLRPIPARPLDAARETVRALVPQLLSRDGQVQQTGIELIAKYNLEGHHEKLLKLTRSSEAAGELRAAALTALLVLKPAELPEALDDAVSSDIPELRMAAMEGLVQTGSPLAVETIAAMLAFPGATLKEMQHAIALLPESRDPGAEDLLGLWLTRFFEQPEAFAKGIQLDVLLAAERRGGEKLTPLLARLNAAADPANPYAAFRVCLEGGDAARGKEIFFGNAAASCRRCHKVEGEGSDVGPDLSGVGKTNTREYLLESLLNPNAKIAKGFETVVFVTNDGRVYTGVVKAEDDTSYQLMTAQGELVRVEKAQIEERAVGKSGMPEDVTKALSKSDVRDLVEYLSQLQNPAPAAAHGKSE
jgi:quinoprotein glucose dehydrogenase